MQRSVRRAAATLALTVVIGTSSSQAQGISERCAELKSTAEQYEMQKRYALLDETLRLRASECSTASAFFESAIALIRVTTSLDNRDPEGGEQKSAQRRLQAMKYLEEALHQKHPPLSERDAATGAYHIKRLQQTLVLLQLVPSDSRERYTVELDGTELKLASDRFWTTPGSHALVLAPKVAGNDALVPELPVLTGGQTHVVQVTPIASPQLGGGTRPIEVEPGESQRKTRDKAETLASVTNVMLIGGGIAVAASVAWSFLFASKDARAATAQAQLSLLFRVLT